MSLRYGVYFFLRRYMIIILLIVMPKFSLMQIFGQIFSTMFVASFVAGVRPYTMTFANRQEAINEMMVLVAAYPLFCFTEWVDDEDVRTNAGWVIIACIVLNVIFNIALLIYKLIKAMIRKCQLYKMKKKAINDHKEQQEQLKKRNDYMIHLFSQGISAPVGVPAGVEVVAKKPLEGEGDPAAPEEDNKIEVKVKNVKDSSNPGLIVEITGDAAEIARKKADWALIESYIAQGRYEEVSALLDKHYIFTGEGPIERSS